MRHVAAILCSLLILTTALSADLYAASFTGPVALQLPGVGQTRAGGARPRVFWRAGNGKWQPAQVQSQDGRLLFKLDPGKLGSSEVMLLVNPPAGLVLDDFEGPKVTGLKVDGKALKPQPVTDLGALKAAPKQLEAFLTDAANGIITKTAQVTVDGVAVAPGKAAGSGKALALTVPLPEMDYGRHEIVLSAADTSPQRNVSRTALRFEYIESGNVALAAQGAKVAVDSCFSGYESLTPLNDGVAPPPGSSCGNDITWASTETPADHWVEVTLPQPTAIKEVSLYWAAYTDLSHTARHFQVQVPDAAGWKAVYTSPAAGEKESRVTTARFEPVTVGKFRVFMPAGQGSTTRPNLLWLAEVKAR